MAEQNPDAPIYTENEQAVTLILKNDIEKRNVKVREDGTDQTTQDPTQATRNPSTRERILSVIRANPNVTQTQISREIGFPVNSVKYYIRKMRDEKDHHKRMYKSKKENGSFSESIVRYFNAKSE